MTLQTTWRYVLVCAGALGVSVFCIPPAHDSTTDTNDGLPGPGAVSPGKMQLLP